MYGNYNNMLNQQANIERLTNQINELERMRNQLQSGSMQNTTPSINQTFQLAPNNGNGIKYAASIEDVNKEYVYVDTPFFDRDFSTMWLKSPKGEVKAFTLTEVVQKDEKDLKIEFLMAQIEDLKKERNVVNEQYNSNDDEPVANKKPQSFQTTRGTKKK